MKINLLLFFAFLLFFVACNQKNEKKSDSEFIQTESTNESFDFGVWITSKKNKTDEEYTLEFKKYKNSGIDEILINTKASSEELKRLVPIASREGLRVHAWITAMNRPGDTVALKHPEWYTVSRNGESCFDNRPYVDYYQWLCPTRKESRNHVLSLIEGLAKVEGIESVHLDYIRFSDVFLPIGLLPKYNLKQETEMAEYDFCYCDVCISEFEKKHHKNPIKIKNIALDMEWKNFRLNAIKSVVDDAYKTVNKYNKKLTAAVFPFPEMAGHMVRQRWDKWDIDEVYPMLYHGFYNEEIDWIGYACKQGISDLKGKNVKLNVGVFLPSFKSNKELKEAILLVRKNKAQGITFFDGPLLTEDYLKTIKEAKEELKK